MNAHVRILPSQRRHHQAAAAQLAPMISTRWQEQHLPVIAAAHELLELDDQRFAARLATMRDSEGGALIAQLIEATHATSGELEAIYRALYLVRCRLSVGLTAPNHPGADR